VVVVVEAAVARFFFFLGFGPIFIMIEDSCMTVLRHQQE